MAYGIIKAHNRADDMEQLRLKYDSMTSHDITYVGIIQTARASGMKEFPLPYKLTNCHNSSAPSAAPSNEDDHKFALSAFHKYGGIYVPTNMANIHSYNRETMAGCGRMILGSDSHTRYGAIGTMAVGEGGGELAKQLLNRTYDFAYPGVIASLTGAPGPAWAPDVALSIVSARGVQKRQRQKQSHGVCRPRAFIPPDQYRNAIDVMTTETTCWTSIWVMDEMTQGYLSPTAVPRPTKSRPRPRSPGTTAACMWTSPPWSAPSPCPCTPPTPTPSMSCRRMQKTSSTPSRSRPTSSSRA